MKRRFITFICLLCVLSFILCSCSFGKKNEETTSSTSLSDEENTQSSGNNSTKTTDSEYVKAKSESSSNKIDATNITLSQTELSMYPLHRVTLTATVIPSSANDNNKITWKSSNTNIVTVNSGTVTAIKNGIAQVTASLPDGTVASCVITVTDKTLRQIYDSISVDIGLVLSALKDAEGNISTSEYQSNYSAYQTIISNSAALKRIQTNCYGYPLFETSLAKSKLDDFYDNLSKAKESLQKADKSNSTDIATQAPTAKQYLQKAYSLLKEVEGLLKNSK
ncbi:MAG: Ig-like domain-containing protein [Clostridiales bacterium]|nr:Ig-like domain-containing protein [Clostridiales bacterium]